MGHLGVPRRGNGFDRGGYGRRCGRARHAVKGGGAGRGWGWAVCCAARGRVPNGYTRRRQSAGSTRRRCLEQLPRRRRWRTTTGGESHQTGGSRAVVPVLGLLREVRWSQEGMPADSPAPPTPPLTLASAPPAARPPPRRPFPLRSRGSPALRSAPTGRAHA